MKIFLTLVLFCFAGLHTTAQQLSNDEIFFIDSLMNARYKPDAPGAAILVAKNGLPVYRKAYGMASLELGVSNKPEFLFCIASMSKQFYGVCILQLAQEGKLSLSDDIRKYLPNYNSHGRIITISNILTHTSGIPSFTEKPDFDKKEAGYYSKNEMVDYFENDSLMFEPGSDYSYSNSAYMLAALIIEKVSGMRFEDYMHKKIFSPLGMSNTFTGTHEKIIRGLVSGYDTAGTGYKPASFFSWSWPYGGGYLISSVDDMLKWDEALYGNSIVSQSWLQKAWLPFILANGMNTHYGLGWVISDYNGVQIISHQGDINGFHSYGVRIPSNHLYVVVLSNGVASPRNISTDIALHLVGNPYKRPQSYKLPAAKLVEYTGVFDVHWLRGRLASNYGTEKMYRYITVQNDTLYSQVTKQAKSMLLNVGKDLFLIERSRNFIKFNRDNEQKIISLKLYSLPTSSPEWIDLKTALTLPPDQ